MTPFEPQRMLNKYGTASEYRTAPRGLSWFARHMASGYFYSRLLVEPMRWLCSLAAKGKCDDYAWVYSSAWFGDVLEASGCQIAIEGLDNLRACAKPCIFAANHMSTLETFLLPGIIRPVCPITFVVKKSLVELPFFGAVMRSREPVVVERKNPRADLQTMMGEGTDRLARGISLIIFPQSTRTMDFSAEHFNSIAIKLARKADVPVVPVALKTDAWGAGKKIKELGKIRPDLPVRLKFGEPMRVVGNGKAEHAAICDFIGQTLSNWQAQDGVNL